MNALTTNTNASAELADLRRRYGSLESIREELGLSRRQICERLFVDPSAWSRWTAGGEDRAPLRTYKSLVTMLEQNRANAARMSTGSSPTATESDELSSPVHVTRNEAISLGWKFVLLLNTLAILYLLAKIS